MKYFFGAPFLAATLFAAGCATSEPPAASAPPEPASSVSAFGIAVSDLEASAVFYRDTLGMTPVATFSLDYMEEIVLVFPNGGSAIVLMEYTDGKERVVTDIPNKIVFRVEDPAAFANKIREAGYEIVREPVPSEAVGGAIVGFAKDPDGYLIEILPKR